MGRASWGNISIPKGLGEEATSLTFLPQHTNTLVVDASCSFPFLLFIFLFPSLFVFLSHFLSFSFCYSSPNFLFLVYCSAVSPFFLIPPFNLIIFLSCIVMHSLLRFPVHYLQFFNLFLFCSGILYYSFQLSHLEF